MIHKHGKTISMDSGKIICPSYCEQVMNAMLKWVI